METMIGVIIGAIISWILAQIYYKKSSAEIPEWFKPMLKRLPKSNPGKNELIKLFQEAINNDVLDFDIFCNVACPKCKAPINDMESTSFGDTEIKVVNQTCPHCGWNNSIEL